MIDRCRRPSFIGWERYGGRGIAVCQRWLDSFETFLADMGPRPSSKHSIDRIDNDGNYEPGNCRWATATEQLKNSSRARRITYGGDTKNLTEWAMWSGIPSGTLHSRIFRRGWPLERALNTPVAVYGQARGK